MHLDKQILKAPLEPMDPKLQGHGRVEFKSLNLNCKDNRNDPTNDLSKRFFKNDISSIEYSRNLNPRQ